MVDCAVISCETLSLYTFFPRTSSMDGRCRKMLAEAWYAWPRPAPAAFSTGIVPKTGEEIGRAVAAQRRMRLFPSLGSQVDVCAFRRAERAGALRHSLGLLVPNHGRGLRRGERAARDPCAGRGMQPEEPAPGFDRSGEGGAQGTSAKQDREIEREHFLPRWFGLVLMM